MEGLAKQMVYGDGSGNTTTHNYAGTIKSKHKKAKKPCKKGKKVVKTK